jgi:predicted nucleic acid-binding protein
LISDATALICLSKISKLDLLKKVYAAIIIPSSVKAEVMIKGKEGYSGICNAIDSGWIKVIDPRKIINLGLGEGETAAINLVIERKNSIILDDAFAIKAAKAFNIPVVRTTTVIFTACRKKIISKAQALETLNKLIDEGYYISTRDYAALMSKLK